MKYVISFLFVLTFGMNGWCQSNDPKYYEGQAKFLLEKQDVEGALKILTVGINHIPDSTSLYNYRAVILEALMLYEEAIKDFTSGLERTEDSKTKSMFLSSRGGTK